MTPDEFRAAEAGSSAQRPIPAYAPETPRAERVQIRTLTEEEAMEGIGEVEVGVGVPVPAPDGPASEPGSPATAVQAPVRAVDPDALTLVDAKVGDLNGLPIIARDWLAPLGPRLRAESVGKSPEEWRRFAAQEINDRLIATLRDELFLAEARAKLTDEQRAGLRAFLNQLEQEDVRSTYGSRTLADEQARRTSGVGLDQVKQQRERAVLISRIQREKILDRVQVSSRDLRLEYERNFEEYNPPPSAVFRLIRVPSSDAETVAAISEALRTRPFPEVADEEWNQSPEPAVREMPEDVDPAALFGALTELSEKAAALEPGEWAGPIETGGFTRWVYLERVDRDSRSLYDVQLELRERIFQQRAEEEAARYLRLLFERAGITNIDELVVRLVMVAEQWYYQPEP